MLAMSDALLWQLQKNRLRHEIIVAELAKIERAMALRAVPMPRHGMPQCRGPVNCWDRYGDVGEDVKLPDNDAQQSAESRSWKPVMKDRVDQCWNPCKCSSETVPPNKKSLEVKWELTGTTILVKKPKLLMKWSCAVCQVQVNSEKNLQMHSAGKKHKAIIAILESRIKETGGQKTRIEAEPSPGTDQINTLSLKWSCGTCQANGTCQSELEEHLKGTKHQQNITASSNVGSNNHAAKNIAPHESNESQHAEKPLSVGSCNICQTITCSDLEIRALAEQCKNMAVNSESRKGNLDPNGMPQHLEKMNGELGLESHLRGGRHQVDVQVLHKNINQQKNSIHQIAKDQEMCEAQCNAEPQFEHHCESRNNKQKINVTFREGDVTKVSSLHIEASCKEGNIIDVAKNVVSQEKSHDSNVPEHAEKLPSVQSCSICQGICNFKSDLEIGLMCRRHIRAKVKIAKDQEPTPEVEYAVCEAKCNSGPQFHHQGKSRKNQQKFNVILNEGDIAKVGIESTCKEGSNNDLSKDIVSLEAKSEERDVLEHVQKTPSERTCSICQGICNCEYNLKIRTMAMAMYMKSRKAKLIPNGVPKHAKKMNGEFDLERRQLNVQALSENFNQWKNNLRQIAKDQEPAPEVESAVCEAKCNSEPQFDHEGKSRMRQRKFDVMLGKGNIAKVSSLHIESTCKEATNNDTSKDIVSLEGKSQQRDVPEHAEKTPSARTCSICQGICNCESDLVTRDMGKLYCKVTNSESWKAKLIPNSVPQHAEEINGSLDLESQQLSVQALGKKNIQKRINPPEIAKGQISSSEWHCTMCQAKCNSKDQFEQHCAGRKHQHKLILAVKATSCK